MLFNELLENTRNGSFFDNGRNIFTLMDILTVRSTNIITYMSEEFESYI